MFNVEFGSILEAKTGVIIHGCNAMGVMGRGVAAVIKNEYPDVFKSYVDFVKSYENKNDLLGQIDLAHVNNDLIVCNAITQVNFGTNGRYVNYKALKDCFEKTVMFIDDYNIAAARHELIDVEQLTLHYPQIGAGLAGGDWSIISNIIESVCSKYSRVNRTLWLNNY